MNCVELQRILPEIIDGGRSADQEAHLRSCPVCSGLVSDLHLIAREARSLRASDEPSPRVWNSIQAAVEQWESELNLIAEQARSLQASEEPSPRVWNSIEIALRQEGLIRQPQREPALIRSFRPRWSPAWLLPLAALVLVTFGLMVYRNSQPQQIAERPAATSDLQGVADRASLSDDQQLLEMVAARNPAMRETYEANLRHVNAYIHDAEQSVQANPNDEEAQQSLMDAYEQKTVVYEMALDRSLP